MIIDDVSLEPIALMYPYGDAVGDSVIAFDISGKKCFRINIPDGGMAFFGKRHRKLHVSFVAPQPLIALDIIFYENCRDSRAVIGNKRTCRDMIFKWHA